MKSYDRICMGNSKTGDHVRFFVLFILCPIPPPPPHLMNLLPYSFRVSLPPNILNISPLYTFLRHRFIYTLFLSFSLGLKRDVKVEEGLFVTFMNWSKNCPPPPPPPPPQFYPDQIFSVSTDRGGGGSILRKAERLKAARRNDVHINIDIHTVGESRRGKY